MKAFWNDVQISEKVVEAVNIKDRCLGLMLKKSFHGESLFLSPCNSIHTFFMNFKIDVLFLDKDLKVVKYFERCLPGEQRFLF